MKYFLCNLKFLEARLCYYFMLHAKSAIAFKIGEFHTSFVCTFIWILCDYVVEIVHDL